MKGGPSNTELISHHPPEVRKTSKGDATCWTTSRNPPRWHPPWLSNACATRKDPESGCLAKDNPETNPITIKPESTSHVAEQSSWAPSPYCSPLGAPSQWSLFPMLDKSPLSGPGRGPPSCSSTAGYLILGELAGRASHFETKDPNFSTAQNPCCHLYELATLALTSHMLPFTVMLPQEKAHKHLSKGERYKCNLKWWRPDSSWKIRIVRGLHERMCDLCWWFKFVMILPSFEFCQKLSHSLLSSYFAPGIQKVLRI